MRQVRALRGAKRVNLQVLPRRIARLHQDYSKADMAQSGQAVKVYGELVAFLETVGRPAIECSKSGNHRVFAVPDIAAKMQKGRRWVGLFGKTDSVSACGSNALLWQVGLGLHRLGPTARRALPRQIWLRFCRCGNCRLQPTTFFLHGQSPSTVRIHSALSRICRNFAAVVGP